MKEPTMEEVLELVEFGRDKDGDLFITKVKSNVHGPIFGFVEGNIDDCVFGNVKGSVEGDVWGDVLGEVSGMVHGRISGRKWEFVENPKEKAIRLIREGKTDEAIKALEESKLSDDEDEVEVDRRVPTPYRSLVRDFPESWKLEKNSDA